MTTFAATVLQLLAVARSGQPRPAIELVLDLVASGLTVDQVITDVLAPVQLEVGARWAANQWDTGDEHAATAVIDGVLGAIALQTAVPDIPLGRVLVACAEGEHHTMPARMGAELLRTGGWDVTFLGGSLPADDLQRYAATTEPDLVVVSCTVPLFLTGARRCFTAITDLGLRAIAAGAAFGADGSRARLLGANGWIAPSADLTTTLSDLHPSTTPAPVPPEASALTLAEEDLSRACLELLRDSFPRLGTASPEQLASVRQDLSEVLDYLATAIAVGDDTVFADFIEWYGQLAHVRAESPVTPGELVGIVRDVLTGTGFSEAASLCDTHRPAGTAP